MDRDTTVTVDPRHGRIRFLRGALFAPAQLGGRHGVALRRLVVSITVGVVVMLLAAVSGAPWPAAVALGWIGLAGVLLGTVWAEIYGFDSAETKRFAREEDSSAAAADAVIVGASAASLAAIAFVLLDAAHRHGVTKGLFIALAVATIVAAWASVHTVFTLRYARLYYADPIGGISFHSDEQPDYIDLAYMALTIGMTFQVSDTDIGARAIRRTAVRHALLSYVLGAVVVAITINIVATIASS